MGNTLGWFVEGKLSIDLINTEEIRRGKRRDLIATPEEFGVWLTEEELAGTLYKVQLPFDVEVWTAEELGRIHDLRAELRNKFGQIADGGDVTDDLVSFLESFTEKAPSALKLTGGRLVQVPKGGTVERLCSLVAADCLRLIEQNQMQHLRRCSNPDCLFMFMDTSGRRKWCSMERCGNRAKVTRHLKRQEEVGG